MSDDGETTFVSGARLDHLYTHHFRNGEGKYFNIITTEEGETALEYQEPGHTRNRLKLTLTFIKQGSRVKEVTLKRFKFYKNEGWVEQYHGPGEPFKLTHFSFEKLAQLLAILSELDLANLNERRVQLIEGQGVGISADLAKTIRTLLIQPDGQRIVEELVRNGLITSHDIVNLGYRKQQLLVFEELLSSAQAVQDYARANGVRLDQPEKAWQHFFKQNEWIFGYGLDYRFLGILQDEAEVGVPDLSGSNSPTADFLAGTRHFTMLVELKLPGTHLFSPRRNRSGAWKLSTDLYDAVSQILEQKASWQVRSAMASMTRDGSRIEQLTADPKSLLVIGHDDAFSADNQREAQLKLRTFELFRRDTRNVEIVTYSELFERASFIVAKARGASGV